jgi:hypothetical protein
MKSLISWYRWLFWRCMDCGAKLESHPLSARGDVCQKCFDDFNGMTAEELTAAINEDFKCPRTDANGRSDGRY